MLQTVINRQLKTVVFTHVFRMSYGKSNAHVVGGSYAVRRIESCVAAFVIVRVEEGFESKNVTEPKDQKCVPPAADELTTAAGDSLNIHDLESSTNKQGPELFSWQPTAPAPPWIKIVCPFSR